MSSIAAAALFSAGWLYVRPSTASKIADDGPQTLQGFRVELVYAPSLAKEGSWVSLTVDKKGRIIASDQYGLLYRIAPSPIGGPPEKTACEPIRIGVGAAQGMTIVGDDLYVMVNAPGKTISSGLYRISDSNGDDNFDDVSQLMPLVGSGEHGPHAVVAAPDGKSLYFCAGNYTSSPRFTKSRVPAGWGEDQLQPRLDDPAGQANGVPAPGGWVGKCDLRGNSCELVSVGYRNIYDLAFNSEGELFTSDSDLDVDIGMPWYRPPSVLHVTSGADFGWRGGNGIWPTYYPDTLPPLAALPPGSPTGLASGVGTSFPAPYQRALFVGDWSRGTIYAIDLSPAGSSYQGKYQAVASDVGGVTDLAVRPQDGALYFTVGGRQTQSGLYRLVWTGGAESAGVKGVAATASSSDAAAEPARVARRQLEILHGEVESGAVATIWPQLSSPDRFVRFAALTALERTDANLWQERALAEPNVLARYTALIALARRYQPVRPQQWVSSVLDVDFAKLTAEEQQTVLRSISLGVIRFENLTPAMRAELGEKVFAWYPTRRRDVDREIAKLLVRLERPAIVSALAEQLNEIPTSEDAIEAAVALTAAKSGWTTESRTALLDWFDLAAKRHGNRSFYPYLAAARARFVDGMSLAERRAFASRLAVPVAESASSTNARKFVRHWTAGEVVKAVENRAIEGQRNSLASVQAGRRLYLELGCGDCHAIGGEGSSVGPDLTNIGKHSSVADLARAITQPSDEVPDLYRQVTYVVGGRAISGRPTNMTATTISVTTDIRDPASAIKLQRDEIESQTISITSAMPENLLDTLDAEEVASLIAYLRAGIDDVSREAVADSMSDKSIP
jgi:putative heme-binding domain-containing protein